MTVRHKPVLRRQRPDEARRRSRKENHSFGVSRR
jgi:hypothetical protein